ncbi:hypothetical protein B0H19DRAFT_1124539 [Mycena capillaripes]|nr:hypothetical protein B0H19DRAFT_1124539 [Mycena capillaripes]
MSSDDELLQLVADSRLTGYLAGTYDYFLCIPEEVELMWKSRWRIAKIIYAGFVSSGDCTFSSFGIAILVSSRSHNIAVIVRDITSSQLQGSSSTVLIATVDFVLMLRVWILYGRPRWMVFLFAFLGMCEIIVDVFAYRQMKGLVSVSSPMSIIKGCYAYSAISRAASLISHTVNLQTFIMFAMTLYKCIRTLYSADHRVMPVWRLFLRDGVVWFVFVFAAGGSALLIWTVGRETLKQVLMVYVPALVVYSSVSSHTLLNIKRIMASEPPELQINDAPSEPIVFVSGSP